MKVALGMRFFDGPFSDIFPAAPIPDDLKSRIGAVELLKPEGFACPPLSEFRIRPGGRGGLVLGFAGMTEELIDRSIRRMAELIRPLSQRAKGA